MKKARRINILVICLALLALVFAFNFTANVNAYDYPQELTNEGATYRVKERTAEKDLGFGVFYHRDRSTLKINKEGYGSYLGSGIGGSLVIGKEYGQQVNVLEITPSKEVELVPYAYLSKSNWHASSVRDAAEQYELTHPGQKVVAAINGDFFQISMDVKASTGATVGQGEFYKAQSSHNAGQNIAIMNNGEGKQLKTINVNNSELVPTITIYDENGAEVKKFENAKPNAKKLADGEYGFYFAQRPTNYLAKVDDCTIDNVWFVDKADDTTAVTAIQNSFYGKGKITDYIKGEITFNQACFAIKSNNAELNKYLKKGVTVRCQYEFGGVNKDVKAAIGFPFSILQNSVVTSNDTNRHPRTVIGQREDGTMILTVIDGRQKSKDMYGATSIEMAALMSYYGCVDAWNLDGGGSSTLLVRKQIGWDFQGAFNDSKHLDSSWYVTNSPSDGSERRDGNCLLVVAKVPHTKLSIAEVTNNTVKINVAQLTTIDKYKELYLMINNEMYKVENGVVVCNGLKTHEDYIGFLYAKVDGKMINLMSEISFVTAYEYIKELEIEAVIRERKGENFVLIKYRTDSREGIENIYFMVGEERFGTSNPAIYVEQSTDLYDALLNLDVTVIFKGSPIKDPELLKFENVKITVDTDFALNEIIYRNNDLMEDIFKLN